VGSRCVDVLPSPKSQAHCVTPPLEVSVKSTLSGPTPEVGAASKLAVMEGWTPSLTIVKESRTSPSSSRNQASRRLPSMSSAIEPRLLSETFMTGWSRSPPLIFPDEPATTYTAPSLGLEPPGPFW